MDAIVVVLLAACASEPNPSSAEPGMPSAFSDLTKNAQWYLEQVDPAKPTEAFTWQVMAARSYLALGQAKPAAALYQQLQKQAGNPVQAVGRRDDRGETAEAVGNHPHRPGRLVDGIAHGIGPAGQHRPLPVDPGNAPGVRHLLFHPALPVCRPAAVEPGHDEGGVVHGVVSEKR